MSVAINKKPAAGTAGEGKPATGTGRHLDYTLLDYLRQLPKGERVSMADLAKRRGVSERALRRKVEDLRRAGCPICSSVARGQSGYWWGGDNDCKGTALLFLRRAKTALEIADRLRGRQLSFFEVEQ